MVTTIAEIAETSFSAIAAAVSDAVYTATVTKTTRGTFNAATGAYSGDTTTTVTGQGVADSVSKVQDLFSNARDFMDTPGLELFLLRGLSSAPEVNDVLTFNGKDFDLVGVRDILHAGVLFYVAGTEVKT